MITENKNIYSQEELKQLQYLFTKQLPWYFSEHQVLDKDTNYYFFHHFFSNGRIESPFFEVLDPILKILKPYAIINIRANLVTNRFKPIYSAFHTDKFNNEKLHHRTSIFYVNTSNGFTEFKNGDKIMCEENKMISFDANQEHRGCSQTDTAHRIVINLNYFN